MTVPRRDLAGMMLCSAAALMFAVGVILAPMVYASGSDPMTMVMTRSFVVAVVLATALAAMRRPVALPPRERRAALTVGVVYTVQSLCFFSGIARIPVSIGALIEYTYPFQVAVVMWIVFRERITLVRALAIAGAFSGVALVIEASRATGALDLTGVALVAAGSSLLALKVMMSHRVLVTVDSARLALHMSATVAVLLGATFALTDLDAAWPETNRGWLLLAATPVANLAGMVGFFAGLAIIGPTRAAMLANAEPVFILVLAAWLLGESLTGVQLVGAGLVVVSVVLFQRARAGADRDAC